MQRHLALLALLAFLTFLGLSHRFLLSSAGDREYYLVERFGYFNSRYFRRAVVPVRPRASGGSIVWGRCVDLKFRDARTAPFSTAP